MCENSQIDSRSSGAQHIPVLRRIIKENLTAYFLPFYNGISSGGCADQMSSSCPQTLISWVSQRNHILARGLGLRWDAVPCSPLGRSTVVISLMSKVDCQCFKWPEKSPSRTADERISVPLILRISFFHKLGPLEGNRLEDCFALRIAFLHLVFKYNAMHQDGVRTAVWILLTCFVQTCWEPCLH